MQKERNPFRGVKLFFAGYFAVLVLLLTAIGALNWLGYKMADISIQFVLLGLLACSALIAGAVWLVKRISSTAVKLLAGAVSGVLVLAVAAILLLVYSMSMFSNMPVFYTNLESPDGKGAVVLRSVSNNKEVADARRADRLAADPPSAAEEYELSDLAYSYTAYPRVAGFFYNMKKPCEGSVEIGCRSEAKLMYDWPDADTLHMYIENPEDHDFGELILTLK